MNRLLAFAGVAAGMICCPLVSYTQAGMPAPDPIYEKKPAITMSELSEAKRAGVAAVEVSDYMFGNYKGTLAPSPPHADLNPEKAIVIRWQAAPFRLVFWHESSYCPLLELPCGAALCNQFFEGNKGWGELFNDFGRKEKNSFVDIINAGPRRAWIRWQYLCVNATNDSQPALRGTEDYVALRNGLIWRRLTYESLRPDVPEGYSWQPIDFFSALPVGTRFYDFCRPDTTPGFYQVASVVDAFSDKQYRVCWSADHQYRRNGGPELLHEITSSRGFAMVMLFKQALLFTVIGRDGGFPPEQSQVVDHSFEDTGGWGWKDDHWDHWPIGWLNSQSHSAPTNSPYPVHFEPLSHYIVNRPIVEAGKDFARENQDMAHNTWVESRVFYTLMGAAKDIPTVRRIARDWLRHGPSCASPSSAESIRTDYR